MDNGGDQPQLRRERPRIPRDIPKSTLFRDRTNFHSIKTPNCTRNEWILTILTMDKWGWLLGLDRFSTALSPSVHPLDRDSWGYQPTGPLALLFVAPEQSTQAICGTTLRVLRLGIGSATDHHASTSDNRYTVGIPLKVDYVLEMSWIWTM